MKKTDLAKNKGLKIMGQMRQAGSPERFAAGAAALTDRREQRRLDQLAGLVPFAAKLPQALVKQLHDRVAAEGVSLNELTARLLQASLGAPLPDAAPVAPVAPVAAPARKAAAKKVASKKAAADTAPAKKAPADKAPAKKAPAKKAPAKKAAAKKAVVAKPVVKAPAPKKAAAKKAASPRSTAAKAAKKT